MSYKRRAELIEDFGNFNQEIGYYNARSELEIKENDVDLQGYLYYLMNLMKKLNMDIPTLNGNLLDNCLLLEDLVATEFKNQLMVN